MKISKKLMIGVMLFISTIALSACGNDTTTATYSPEFQGFPADFTYVMKTGEVFDPYKDVFATDPKDGDVSASVYIVGLEALELSSTNKLTKSGEFELVYTVINSSGKKAEQKITVIVTDFFEDLAKYEVGEYQLVWSDEFDYVGAPDSTKWATVNAGGGFGNWEYQFYTNREKNVYVDGDYLNLNLFKEDYENHSYTSGKIYTKGIESWTYGKMEIRVKVPKGKGTWPAVWMMPQDSNYGTWPRSGEIDIMEHVGYDLNRIYGTIHVKEYNGMDGTQRGGNKVVDTATSEFHTYSIEWLPNVIIWSIDGVEYYRYEFAVDAYSTLTEDEYWKIWPYDQDFYLILNLAFGGSWGAAQGIDESLTEATMLVDYVRVYQAEITETE